MDCTYNPLQFGCGGFVIIKHFAMNNYILINITYAETTPDSAEIGDFSDQGFVKENQRVTFKELVALMKIYRNACASGEPGITWWFSCGWFNKDSKTNTEREESIHYSRDNPPNCEKYWLKAANIAQKAR